MTQVKRVFNAARKATAWIELKAVLGAYAAGLGEGSYGAAFELDDGSVIKIGASQDGTAGYIYGVARHFLLTGKVLDFAPRVHHYEALSGELWIAHMEYVEPRQGWEGNRKQEFYGEAYPELYSACRQFIQAQEGIGFVFMDDHSGNWGRTADGRMVIFDPTAISSSKSGYGYLHLSPKSSKVKKLAAWKRPGIAQLHHMRMQ